MAAVTYISNPEQKILHNEELNDLLGEISSRWLIEEKRRIVKYWCKADEVFYDYTLYRHLDGTEYQVISFYREDPWNPRKYRNSAELIVAYLYGILSKDE